MFSATTPVTDSVYFSGLDALRPSTRWGAQAFDLLPPPMKGECEYVGDPGSIRPARAERGLTRAVMSAMTWSRRGWKGAVPPPLSLSSKSKLALNWAMLWLVCFFLSFTRLFVGVLRLSRKPAGGEMCFGPFRNTVDSPSRSSPWPTALTFKRRSKDSILYLFICLHYRLF